MSPASISSAMFMVVTPVVWSPARMDQAIGAAPAGMEPAAHPVGQLSAPAPAPIRIEEVGGEGACCRSAGGEQHATHRISRLAERGATTGIRSAGSIGARAVERGAPPIKD